MILGLVFAGSAALAGLVLLASRPAPLADLQSTSSASSRVLEVSSPGSAELPSAQVSAISAPPSPAAEGVCSSDMVLVEGFACPFAAHRCDKKRKELGAGSRGDPGVCERFRDEVLCEGKAKFLRFCVDRFEYPNRAGAYPAVLVSYDEASAVCELEEKRLCTVREWQFSCEGEAVRPYATGLSRERGLCNWDAGPLVEVVPSRGASVAEDFARSDRRSVSGAHSACASSFGVLDQSGNVREWVTDPEQSRMRAPFTSSAAGGAWGGGASTCRSLNQDLAPAARSASLGFRCCRDAPDTITQEVKRRPPPSGLRKVLER
jgi:formylglycine-generating enzyme